MPSSKQGFSAAPTAMGSTRRLSSFDSQFLAMETGNMRSHYMGVLLTGPDADGRTLTAERVREHIASRIDRLPPLRLRLRPVPFGLDHPLAVDGDVDLEQHVIASTVAPPGGPDELAVVVERILSEKLDRSRPLWEFHVIDGLDDGRVAVGMKFHHAAADALGASGIAGVLLDPSPTGERPGRLPDVVPVDQSSNGPVRELARGLVRTARHPLIATRAAATSLPHIDQIPVMRTLPGARAAAGVARRVGRLTGTSDVHAPDFPHAPKMRFNGRLSGSRSIGYGSVPVSDVRALKDAFGVSFNDVVVAAIAGGLRRRLKAGDELPADPLLAFVPANVRTDEASGAAGNAISSFVVPVPTHLDLAQDRVRASSEAMGEAKARHLERPASLVDDVSDLIPPLAFRVLAGGITKIVELGGVAAPINFILSNVPGPPVPVYLDGAPVERFLPLSVVFGGFALNVTVFSYAGTLELGVVGDGKLLPDATELIADIEAEFASLAEAAGLVAAD